MDSWRGSLGQVYIFACHWSIASSVSLPSRKFPAFSAREETRKSFQAADCTERFSNLVEQSGLPRKLEITCSGFPILGFIQLVALRNECPSSRWRIPIRYLLVRFTTPTLQLQDFSSTRIVRLGRAQPRRFRPDLRLSPDQSRSPFCRLNSTVIISMGSAPLPCASCPLLGGDFFVSCAGPARVVVRSSVIFRSIFVAEVMTDASAHIQPRPDCRNAMPLLRHRPLAAAEATACFHGWPTTPTPRNSRWVTWAPHPGFHTHV